MEVASKLISGKIALSSTLRCMFWEQQRMAFQYNDWCGGAELPAQGVGLRAAKRVLRPEPEETENALIARVCEGDYEAFYELVRPCERAIFFAATSVLHNDADAEEAAQEAVLKAFTHIRSFRAESKFSTWLIQITINEARMKLRRDHRHLYDSLDQSRVDEEGSNWPRDFADWREIPSETLEQKELRDTLNRALDSLAPKYREVIVCRDVQHLSIAETAQVLGISTSNVKTRLLRARLRMRDALAPGLDGSWRRGPGYKKVRPW